MRCRHAYHHPAAEPGKSRPLALVLRCRGHARAPSIDHCVRALSPLPPPRLVGTPAPAREVVAMESGMLERCVWERNVASVRFCEREKVGARAVGERSALAD